MKKRIVPIILCLLFSCLSPPPARAAEPGVIDSQWHTFPAGRFTISCHPEVNLEWVDKSIRIRFRDVTLKEDYPSLPEGSAERRLAEKFNRIFQKTEKVLDMYPRGVKLTVKIYKNQPQLDKAWREMFGEKNFGKAISFYVHKYTTVYTTESAIREGIIAHELGHAVVDHYFLILPPERIQELLAQYAELHLED